MKTIRQHSFETNSSSTHSLTINHMAQRPEPIEAGTEIPIGEFGWEFRSYNSFEDKASYFWTIVSEVFESADWYIKNYKEKFDNCLKIKTILEGIGEKYGVTFQDPKEKWGYVDHGTEHLENFMSYYNLTDPDELEKILTDPDICIQTGNDNEY